MKLRKTVCLLTTVLFIFFLTPAAFALRRSQTPYERCQNFLETVNKHLEKSASPVGSFPPAFLRFDPQTGAIPDEFFVEEALISDVKYLNLLQPDCHYALAPWAFPGPDGSRGRPHDLYCVSHGFPDHLNRNNQDIEVTPDSIRSYFISSCQKNGIDPQKWQTTLAAFNPDLLNVRRLDFIQREFINLANSAGPLPVLFFQALLALAGCLILLKRLGKWQGHLWVGIAAWASLWTGLQMFYLLIFRTLTIEAMHMTTRSSAKMVLAGQEIMSILLLPFFIAMIFNFWKTRRPIAPIVGMILATLAGTVITNILTVLIGIWAFWSILQSEPKTK